jgi:hypothetical protein
MNNSKKQKFVILLRKSLLTMNRVFLFTFVIFLSGCSMNHYEKGKEYMTEKQYSEAIEEFQKIDPGEKDYRMSQSKISYIQGLLAFNDSLMQAAEMNLRKVEADDEFYHDSQLMLDKIRQKNERFVSQPKDTVIIREEITGTKGIEKEKEAETAPSDAELTGRYTSQMEDIINRFESLYQSAYTASTENKKNYLSNMRSALNQLNTLSYRAKEKDAGALELKQKANDWMNKRISFISKLIADNTIAETNTSRSLKEEGDKLYYSVVTQLKKVK